MDLQVELDAKAHGELDTEFSRVTKEVETEIEAAMNNDDEAGVRRINALYVARKNIKLKLELEKSLLSDSNTDIIQPKIEKLISQLDTIGWMIQNEDSSIGRVEEEMVLGSFQVDPDSKWIAEERKAIIGFRDWETNNCDRSDLSPIEQDICNETSELKKSCLFTDQSGKPMNEWKAYIDYNECCHKGGAPGKEPGSVQEGICISVRIPRMADSSLPAITADNDGLPPEEISTFANDDSIKNGKFIFTKKQWFFILLLGLLYLICINGKSGSRTSGSRTSGSRTSGSRKSTSRK